MAESEPDKKRLLVSRDTRTEVWTDDQGDQWKPYHVPDSRYTEGAWLVFSRGNSFEMFVQAIYSDEVDARREAMRDWSVPQQVVFVPWDKAVTDPLTTERKSVDARPEGTK